MALAIKSEIGARVRGLYHGLVECVETGSKTALGGFAAAHGGKPLAYR
ncbi:MAG TPA: hypothetical protein VK582_22905 [Pyrinomonadaceae bacterium]|nr:hypothetical protein [Pyrinomonadaceae bacterium]